MCQEAVNKVLSVAKSMSKYYEPGYFDLNIQYSVEI
jgi:hypothetical protein